MSITDFIKRHQVPSFVALAFLCSWLAWGVLFFIAPGGAILISVPLILYSAWSGPLVGPALVGVILTRVVGGKEGLRELLGRLKRWRVGITWYGVAVLNTPLIAMVVLGVMAVTISSKFLPTVLTGQFQNVTLVVAASIAGGVSSFLEELGWTGFALPRLLAQHRALVAGLILGVIWGLWHVVINVWAQNPRFSALSLITYVLGAGTAFAPLVAYRVLMTWVYINSKGSLLLAWIMHWFMIVWGYVLIPSLSTVASVQYNAAWTAALWIAVAVVVAAYGAKLTRVAP